VREAKELAPILGAGTPTSLARARRGPKSRAAE